jgi:hypothetical protein
MRASKGVVMSNESLRKLIVEEMRRNQKESEARFGAAFGNGYIYPYCTWWFKFKIPEKTGVIRRELERMEKDGLVCADRSYSNNTRWTLTENQQTEGE